MNRHRATEFLIVGGLLVRYVEPLPPGNSLHIGTTVAVPGEPATQIDPGIQCSLPRPRPVLAGTMEGDMS
jgi:hypothetical protein